MADLPMLISAIKAGMRDKLVDPYLQLVEDSRLQASHVSPHQKADYASEEDEAALKFLEELENDDEKLKEITVPNLVQKFEKLPEDELISIKEQILQGFSPEDAFPLGAPLFIDAPYSCSPFAQKECEYFDESMASFLEDEDIFPDACDSQSDRKMSESMTSEVISVNQLIESVLETARQVATVPVSTTPVHYDQMKSQCEALVIGKQQKMSVLLSFKRKQEGSGIAVLLEDNENDSSAQNMKTQQLVEDEQQKSTGKESVRRCDSMWSDSEKSLRLPPASSYDILESRRM